MASRSFKQVGYLASSQQSGSSSIGHQARPSFARSTSSSSTRSNTSDDSFIATLRSLSIDRKDSEFVGSLGSTCSAGASGGVSPRCCTPGSRTSQQFGQQFGQSFEDTPGRKRSQPIAIDLPPRDRAAYTPLSARGDLPGGYFPNHEAIQKQYQSHPFSKATHQLTYRAEPTEHSESTSTSQSPCFTRPMSNLSSTFSSPADNTPKVPHLISSGYTPGPTTETMSMPMGKYHPSNYKHVSPAISPAPTSVPGPPTNFEIPAGKRKHKQPGHERRPSDVKRKLQQYQRDMIAQARLAQSHSGNGPRGGPKPVSPRIMPLGSPGPVTPFELEESAGFLVAGGRAAGGSERDMVDRMIKKEERRIGHREGSGSPVLI